MKKAEEEFVVGKNNIGFVSSSFESEFGNDEIENFGQVLRSQKLTKSMRDEEIISELKVEECTLSDVLATLKNATEDMKDGYSNIFYIKGHSLVVLVYWHDGRWLVSAWRRDVYWLGGDRVFSPATGAVTPSSSPCAPLTQKSAEDIALKFCKKHCGGRIEAFLELRDLLINN